MAADEVFVSSGASDELGDILDLFERSSSALVIEPAYPAYVDANVMAGRKIVHLSSSEENSFLPEPSEDIKADLLYICSPNNPTGAVFSREQLQVWVDFAEVKTVRLFYSMRHMKPSLKMKHFPTAFLNWMEQKHVRLKYVHCLKRLVLQVRGLDIR